MKIELSKDMINNLAIFLDRVEYKGLNEVQAINQIMDAIYEAQKEANKKSE